MAEYQDKTEDKIKQDVSDQFKKDDIIGNRDDYEIYASAKKVIDSYVKEITTSNEIFWPRALQEFSKLDKELSKEMATMQWFSLMFKNKEIINDLANRIDNVESIVISRLALNRTNKVTIDAQKINAEYFTVAKDGCLLLASWVNKPAIDVVLWKIFAGKTDMYKIDYSDCKNEKIKNKMIELTWWKICYISYDATQKTYLLRNAEGATLSQRALIREGVKLIPMGVVKFTAEQTQEVQKQQQNEKISEFSTLGSKSIDEIKKDPKRLDIIKEIPVPLLSKLTVDPIIFKQFLEKNEKRMDGIIQDAKAKNYMLHTDPVSKLYTKSWLMEVHLINGTAEKNITVWNDNHNIGNQKLYDILDSEENAYKEFLTKRIIEKRNDYNYLTKKEDILSGANSQDSKEKNPEIVSKDSIIYALSTFKQMLDAMRLKEWNSWDDDDKEFAAMIKHIDNSIYSLQKNENISQSALDKNIIKPLKQKWNEFQLQNGSNASLYSDTIFANIFSWDKSKTIEGIRKLWQATTVLGNTHTSFLQDEIVDHLEITDEDINETFQNITTKLEIASDDSKEAKDAKIQLMDQLYAAKDGQGIETILVDNGMLSAKVAGNKDIVDMCTNLKSKLLEKKQGLEKLPYNLDSLAAEQKNEQLSLETKPEKTEADLIKLQALQYLMDNRDMQNKLNQETLDAAKSMFLYTGIGQMTKSILAASLVDLGGWATGKNADIYNDIVGYGNFNVSDKNAEIIGEITKEVLITIVVCILTAWVWWIALSASLKLVSAGARAVKATGTAERILQFAKLWKTTFKWLEWWKQFNTAEKVAKIAYRGTALLIEAPAFNSASKALKSTIAGNEIDMWWSDINPLAKENIQTAAFLWALHGANVLKWFLKIDFWAAAKTFVESWARAKAWWAYTADIGTEFVAMMWAEQAINLTFGRAEFDPKTGEMHVVRWLHIPNQQELAQMIGMILGMRASARFNLMPKVEAMLAKWDLVVSKITKDDIKLLTKTGEEVSIKEISSNEWAKKINKIKNKEMLEEHKKKIEEYTKEIEILKNNIDTQKKMLEGERESNDYDNQRIDAKSRDIKQIKEKILDLEKKLLVLETNVPEMPSRLKVFADKILWLFSREKKVSIEEIEKIEAEVRIEEANNQSEQWKNWLNRVREWIKGVKVNISEGGSKAKEKMEEHTKKIEELKDKIENQKLMIEVDEGMSSPDYQMIEASKNVLKSLENKLLDLEKESLVLESNMPEMPSRLTVFADKILWLFSREKKISIEEVEKIEEEIKIEEVNNQSEQWKNWLNKTKEWIKSVKANILENKEYRKYRKEVETLKSKIEAQKLMIEADEGMSSPDYQMIESSRNTLRSFKAKLLNLEGNAPEMPNKLKLLADKLLWLFEGGKKISPQEVKSVEQELIKKESEIIAETKNSKIKELVKIRFSKAKEWLINIKKLFTKNKTIEGEKDIADKIKDATSMEAIIHTMEGIKGIDAYTQGKVEADGSISPSWDKEFLKSPEIVQALKDGNFEELNFQKWDEMLTLRNKWVELYIREKIISVQDMIDFVRTNKKLFWGENKQNSFIKELEKEWKSDSQKLDGFNKKIQNKNSWISWSKSETWFDMKSIVDNKVKELISDIESKEKKSVIEKEVKVESTIETTPIVEKTRFDLRKMSPDTQQVVEKLKAKYPKLEPLLKSMVVKGYDSEIVQEHLTDLNLLPKELINQIKKNDIVFFISNEGVTSWVWNADLKWTIPRGWEETGLKRDDVAGMANREWWVHAGKWEHGSVSLVLHELWHQIDIKGVVDTKEISPFYELFKTEKKITDDYLLQEWEAGLQEFSAESFAEFYKLPQSEFENRYNKEYRDFLKDKIKEGEIIPEKKGIQKNKQEEKSENLPATYFENIKTFDELYKKLEEVMSIYDPSSKKTYTTEELKIIIEKVKKWEDIRRVPREGGLRNKVSELKKNINKWAKVKSLVN